MNMKLLAGVSLVATLGMGAAAHAQDAASVQAQLDAMRAEIADLKAQLAAKPVVTAPEAAGYAAPPSALPAPKPEQITEKFDGAVRWVDGLGDSFKVRGRVLLDAVDEHVDRRGSPTRTNYDSFNVRPRQLFLGVEGNIGKQWSYKLEGGARNGATWSWDDAILAYNLSKTNSIIIGNQKTVSLEGITSTRFTEFLDRGPYFNLLQTDYALGLAYLKKGPNFSVEGAVLGGSVNAADVTAGAYGSQSANEQFAATARGTYAIINTPDQKLHVGGWVRYRERGGQTGFVYATNNNSNYNPVQVTPTTGAAGDSDWTIAGEFAYVLKSLSLQAEAANVHVARLNTGRDATLGGSDFNIPIAYGSVSFFLTGETRNYQAGTGDFGRTKVLHPLDQGGTGALELLARVDYADLSDMKPNAFSPLTGQYAAAAGVATAGKYKALTIGANYYPISYVRFMANYTWGDVDNPEYGALGPATRFNRDATINVFQARAQIDF